MFQLGHAENRGKDDVFAVFGLTSGDTIVIQGATPAAYDGTFTVGTVSGTSFTYTLGSTPGSNASGTYMTAAVPSPDQTISRPDGLQDVSLSPSDTVRVYARSCAGEPPFSA